jgi:hypothetical protein
VVSAKFVLAFVLAGFGAYALTTFLIWSGQRMIADEDTNVETSVQQAELTEKDLGYEYGRCVFYDLIPLEQCNQASPNGLTMYEKYYGDGSWRVEEDPFDGTKPGQATLRIVYTGSWSGNIIDSNFDSASYDGVGYQSIAFPCEDSSIFSLGIQKSDPGRNILKLIVEDDERNVLDTGETLAEFGIVSLVGRC